MRYRFAELKQNWNRNAKPEHQINTASGYEALKNEARNKHGDSGVRTLEMPGYYTKTGNPVLLDF